MSDRLLGRPINEAGALRDRILSLERQLESARASLAYHERCCQHDWAESKYTPERRKGYTIEADLPGTMGVDWRPAYHVAPETIDKWTRTCCICGKTETTSHTNVREIRTPKF